MDTPSLQFDSNLAINDQFDIDFKLGLAKAKLKEDIVAPEKLSLEITNVSVAPRY